MSLYQVPLISLRDPNPVPGVERLLFVGPWLRHHRWTTSITRHYAKRRCQYMPH
jgi:hypothetical protein